MLILKLSFMQLSIWSNNFFDKNFKPTIWSMVHHARMQLNFLCNRHAKNEFCGECSNNNFNFETRATSEVRKSHNKDPIVKLGLFGHNSLNYCAYLSSPWPWTIISMRVMDNFPSPNIVLLHTCNLGSAIFTWSILSWILQRNSSFDRTNSILQVWYKFLHDSWCKICFLIFTSYFKASLLLFPDLDIKFLRDSQLMHFANTDPHFHTSTFKWCLFFNLLITDWEIPLMFNSLLIYQPTNMKTNKY